MAYTLLACIMNREAYSHGGINQDYLSFKINDFRQGQLDKKKSHNKTSEDCPAVFAKRT